MPTPESRTPEQPSITAAHRPEQTARRFDLNTSRPIVAATPRAAHVGRSLFMDPTATPAKSRRSAPGVVALENDSPIGRMPPRQLVANLNPFIAGQHRSLAVGMMEMNPGLVNNVHAQYQEKELARYYADQAAKNRSQGLAQQPASQPAQYNPRGRGLFANSPSCESQQSLDLDRAATP